MIRQILFVVLAFHFCSRMVAQNLVPNYSFEIYDTCPNGPFQIAYAAPWTIANLSSPDYFNDCSSNYASITNIVGGGGANSGIGCTGGALYAPSSELRECIQVQLTSPLTGGVNYYAEFYVSLSDSSQYAISNIGAYFSTSFVSSSNGNSLPYSPQIFNPDSNIISDKIGWTKISGTFTALGGEQYIVIGNFKDNANTNNLYVGNAPYLMSYYYYDDVSVIPDSLTGVPDLASSTNLISIYPNPASEEINIITTLSQNETGTIVIENVVGQMLMTRSIVAGENNLKVSVSELAPGIYIYREIINGVLINSRKIIIER